MSLKHSWSDKGGRKGNEECVRYIKAPDSSYRGSRREWEFKEGFLEKMISESDRKE